MLSFAAVLLVSLAASSADGAKMPNKSLGVYILMAHDKIRGYHTDSQWSPMLYPWQQTNLNLLYFAFINPETMKIPYSFRKLAATRGTGAVGAVPRDTVILFSIGGASYSRLINPWQWLTSEAAAKAMAAQVAQWPALYGCDGIDMDIEKGAGGKGSMKKEPGEEKVGNHLIAFLSELKRLNPTMIVTMAVARRPHIEAQNSVVNEAFRPDGRSGNLIDGSIGVMRYVGAESLTWVHNYDQATTHVKGKKHVIKVDVPRSSISVGCSGQNSEHDTMTLMNAVTTTNLRGLIVWYASVINGFAFQKGRGDASNIVSKDYKYKNSTLADNAAITRKAFGEVMRQFNKFNP